MKFQKSVLSLLLITLLLFLAACGDDSEEGNDGDSEAASGEKITIFQSKAVIQEPLEELAQEYTEETGVEVEVWGTTGDDYFTQLQTRLNSNQGPSIFSLRHMTEAERLESYAVDLSDEEYVQHIAPNMELELNGKLLGIPYGVEGFGLVYNKDLINPEDVADYESFISTLEQFNEEDINGLSLAQDAFFLIGHISNYPFSLQDDNYEYIQQLTAGEVTMADTEEFQEFGEMMEDIRANIANPLDVTYDEQIGDFATGKTAMIHQGNWAFNMFEDYELDFEMGLLPVPLMDNDKLPVGVGNNWAVNSTKSEEEIQAAKDFLDWLHTSETGQEYIVEVFNFVPALTNIEANNLDPLSQAVLEASNSGETIPWSHTLYPANIVVNDFTSVAESFFLSEDMSGEELVESLDSAWQNVSD